MSRCILTLCTLLLLNSPSYADTLARTAAELVVKHSSTSSFKAPGFTGFTRMYEARPDLGSHQCHIHIYGNDSPESMETYCKGPGTMDFTNIRDCNLDDPEYIMTSSEQGVTYESLLKRIINYFSSSQ